MAVATEAFVPAVSRIAAGSGPVIARRRLDVA
jgi:hypothetical protein